MLENAIMSYGGANVDFAVPSPGSPPGMSSSRSSKASSMQSFNSDDDNSVLADVGHFEEIGLDDDAATIDASYAREAQIKPSALPHGSQAPHMRHGPPNKSGGPLPRQRNAPPRDLARPPRNQINGQQRDLVPSLNGNRKPSFPSLSTQFRDTSTRSLSTGIGPDPQRGPIPIRGLAVRSASSLGVPHRRRSPSPSFSARSVSPRDPNFRSPHPPRRSNSWQNGRDRKSINDIEKEYDEEDDDDNIPDGFLLDNVPLSPRPLSERSPTPSRSPSTSASPERSPKERVRSVGNGTPPVAVASGSLRSPAWKTDSAPPSPLKARAKSWTAAASGLNAEALALTEKLEEHADELEQYGGLEAIQNQIMSKPRVKSALAELPPIRRSNIMIDPLPISKEKEAVLSRTRPSWLPPKNPAEEKKHLKEYQRMMANSVQADKKREAMQQDKERSKDQAANRLIQIWEKNVLSRWDDAIRERRTRDLWWKGVAPRCRGTVWSRAIRNELGLNEASFHAARARAREVDGRISEGKANVEDERRSVWFKQISKDVEESTFVDLRIFQSGGPLHDCLVDVLRAYAMYRSDVGYVSGCNTIAALMLLNLPTPATAFVALANVLNRSLPISFYACDLGAKMSAYNLVIETLSKKSPDLHRHLTNRDLALDPEDYLGGLFTSLFTSRLGLEECTRLWDVYVLEGDSVLVRAAVALLLEREAALLGASTTIEVQKALEYDGKLSERSNNAGDEWMARVRDAGKTTTTTTTTTAA